MHTHWGDLKVSDSHIHFLSRKFFLLLAAQKDGLTLDTMQTELQWNMPPESPSHLAARWVEELDRHDIDRACLIASMPGDENSVAAAVAAHPSRFYGYFFLNPASPFALETLEKALAMGLRVPCLFPAMHQYPIADGRVTALLERLEHEEKPVVFVHCGVLTVGVRKRLGIVSRFDMRFSNPIDLHGIAMRFPTIRFVIPHFGAGYFRESLMLADMCPNVYLDTSSSNSWIRYLPGSPDLASVFRQALNVVGAKRLLFGTDSSFFPRGWHAAVFDAQAKALEQVGATPAEASAIFHGNLEELLG